MNRLVSLALLLCLLSCCAFSVDARRQKHGVLSALDAAITGAEKCTAAGGSCVNINTCQGSSTVKTGLCPGSASIICCIAGVAAAPALPSPPTPAPTPAPAPAFPNSAKCAAVNGACGLKSACTGTVQTGLCPGDSSIACCISSSVAQPKTSDSPSLPNVVPSPNKPLNQPAGYKFPYTFPYSQERHVVADFALQRIRLYDGPAMVKEWKISSGVQGIGFKPDVPATPAGKFRIVAKIGNNQPLGMIIEKQTPQGRIAKETDAHAYMTTRLLVLDGLDPENKNTINRNIYIHGTNREHKLGNPASHGCFRMANADVVELFNAINKGALFFAAPSNAWPF